ncbi:hypothetical protein IMZ48_18830 [Candidatus Bathyarchaeota archaeon]|nr:hypothetical protein [Candidatus Bathyarchaeota archaeon]
MQHAEKDSICRRLPSPLGLDPQSATMPLRQPEAASDALDRAATCALNTGWMAVARRPTTRMTCWRLARPPWPGKTTPCMRFYIHPSPPPVRGRAAVGLPGATDGN